ncbi:MAG TPA: polyribonucleotide nucleotidyltransferase [Candidatus Paceibacterota bacterium]|nr:polyribonucleotide nucleotidyltransferase [Candidatus Paceibacterota bacterium]HOL53961.1 polyribonucleotide nucleotidyltransferase [Candidatus Paceibacterota bacterium]HON21618.1 polyribonucleotide nucleotidyltransferase [Candidatus Paceibacterota bacterium]HPP16878.1 polyribonucleotide nucleotidyltransferase [Candidatus Paceibacterota bacterium]
MLNEKIFSLDIGGRTLTVKFTPLAPQTNGAVLVQYGETTVLVTATMGKTDRLESSFFPLVVDYEERFYAAGKILGSRFVRREGKPSEGAILTARLIDRSIRPLFDQNMRREVQVVATVLSIDADNDPDFPALIGTSIALATSDIPWNGPISAIRIGLVNNEFKVNPTYQERNEGQLDFFLSSADNKITMLEVGGDEVPEEKILQATNIALTEIEKLQKFQSEIIKEMAKPKTSVVLKQIDPTIRSKTKEFIQDKLEDAIYTTDKMGRASKLSELKKSLEEYLKNDGLDATAINEAFFVLEEEIDALVHKNILENDKRPDGRALDEIRPIHCEVGVIPRVHGSGLFIRGTTQALSIITLAAPSHALTVETIEECDTKRFIHHYNFPPYSVGEISSMRGPGRREIGHGALAEKSLYPIIPNKDEFPYTIRIVSEILSSNGSSSMASVCGSSLALMDAGVPIKKPVAGIAMGLMLDNESHYKILTDIQGPEDHYGDMDLKVAGTSDGITGMQMDVKITGITPKMLEEGLAQAKKARLQILQKIAEVIEKPRTSLSPHAPKIFTMQVNPDKIRDIIGSGGKTINDIIKRTGVEIDIDEDGQVFITAPTDEAGHQAMEIIKDITYEFKEGDIVTGTVSRILEFGAIVDLEHNRDGLLHISEIADRRIDKVEDVLKVGQTLTLKIIKIDETTGRINLSLKALQSPDNYSSPNQLPNEKSSERRSNYQKHSSYQNRNQSRNQRRRRN